MTESVPPSSGARDLYDFVDWGALGRKFALSGRMTQPPPPEPLISNGGCRINLYAKLVRGWAQGLTEIGARPQLRPLQSYGFAPMH